MRRSSLVMGGFILAVIASVAAAQPPGGQGRDGGGGFGPFPFGRLGGSQSSAATLIGMPEVQQELAVTDEQRKQVDELLRDLEEQMRASFGIINFQELATLSDEERFQRFEEARKKADEANQRTDEKLGKILESKQLQRLNQLRLQREGIAAFGRADVAKQFGLTDKQQEQIRKIEESSRPDFGSGFGPPDFARIEEQRQRALTEIEALLSDVQKEKWAVIKGKEFKFAAPQVGFGPGGRGGFGPGGPMGQERKIVKDFDKDGDARLNAEERRRAREALKSQAGGGRGFGPGGPGFGPPGGPFGRGNREPPKSGPRVSPAEVDSYPDASLYEPTVLRTLFLDFESDDWEAELADFHGTDAEVPATLTVDGKKYPNVGVHFRGMSSYMGVPAGYKRSLNLSLDFVDSEQRLYGYKTLNLLNGHEDPSFMSSVLYSHIARQYIPAPKANLVKLVINGSSWGVYANVQQFDKIFLPENFKTTKGARWKVSGNPGADGGLRYLGDNIDEYKRRFEIKSGDIEKSWRALIALCRTLNETPLDQLESALDPILDIDGVLWFLALDVALINNDGYWTRASDYNLFLDERGKFHIIPHDMNEAFHGAMMFGPGGPGFGPGGPRGPAGFGPPGDFGPGGRPGDDRARDGDRRPAAERGQIADRPRGNVRAREGDRRPDEQRGRGDDRGPGGRGPGVFGPGGPGFDGGGVELDPLVGLNNLRTPLRSRLLAVPSLRARYLEQVRTIAEESLDWNKLGSVVAQYRKLIEAEVEADTRKLDSFDAFQRTTADEPDSRAGRGREIPLRTFADQRRKYLLNYEEPR
jgi:spore coat protein CotH